MMKKLLYLLIIIAAGILAGILNSCDDGETYAEQKAKERAAINQYISDYGVTVITEAEFEAQDCTTDTSKNEFVLLGSSGVYMQIVRKGCGEQLVSGETATVLVRFTEYNLLEDTLQLTNDILTYSSVVDVMTVSRSGNTFTGYFDANNSLMYYAYGSTSVPSGWLYPFEYVNVGRPESDDDEVTKLVLIVPHSEGHAYASSGVYPCLYYLTYQRGR